MKILVTGSAGFIGSRIVDMLLGIGHEVVGVDNLSTGRVDNFRHNEFNPAFRFYEANIVNEEALRSIFWKEKPDIICHQAAQASLLTSHKRPAYDAKVNIIGTINLLKMAQSYRCKKIVFASTGAVFSADQHCTYTEETQPLPDRPYGMAKFTAEMYIRASGVPHMILRYGNVYGPRQVPVGENQLVARLCSHIFKGTPFKIFGDGTHARTFIYVDDIARANLIAIHSEMQGTYHTYGNPTRAIDMINLVLDETKYNPEMFERTPEIPGEPDFVCMDTVISAWRNAWRQHFTLRDGIKNTVEWWRHNA